MNTISKDQSIITQVAAKIAADLTPKTDDIMTNIANWAIAFDATTDALLEKHGMSNNGMTEQEVTQAVISTFGATPVETPAPAPQASAPAGGFQVRIKGKQHGPIPAWLHNECAKVGVTEVWDNRDGLSANPKRPWFKAVQGDSAFWEPRAKR
jgi:hypothetical protein